MTPFIIVGMPRTGSTLLLRSLQQHPRIRAYGELFHWLPTERMSSYHAIHAKSATIAFDADRGNALEFLREWVWCQANANCKAVGFKIFAEHAVDHSSPAFFPLLLQEFPDLHVIHVRRRNYLDVFVSWLMAQQTGVWFVPAGGESHDAADKTVAPTPAEAEAFFAKMEAADRFLQDTFGGRHYHCVEYEDLSRDIQRASDAAFRYLGVDPAPVTPSLRKQIEREVSDVVSNYEQLRQHFSRSRHALFFGVPPGSGGPSDPPNFASWAYAASYRILPPHARQEDVRR